MNIAFNNFELIHYTSNSKSTLGGSIEDIGLLILALDMLVTLNTRIFLKGKEVEDRYQIF